MRYRLNRYTIPRMLRGHKVAFMIGLGYGGISAAVLAGAAQTAIHASRPGVSLAGELAWRIGLAVAILVGLAGLFGSIFWLAVTQAQLAEAKRRRMAEERGFEEPLALWRVRVPAPTRQWRPRRRSRTHHARRRT
jgi:hypothetical protein